MLFPRSGCQELHGQIFNLGIESHDDLNDACVYLIQGLSNQGLELSKIQWIEAWSAQRFLGLCGLRQLGARRR